MKVVDFLNLNHNNWTEVVFFDAEMDSDLFDNRNIIGGYSDMRDIPRDLLQSRIDNWMIEDSVILIEV